MHGGRDQIDERVLRAIAENATDAIIVADSEGRVVRVNRATEQMLGFSNQELAGKPLTELMPERYRDQHTAGLNRLRTGGERRLSGLIELEALHKDGHEVPFELTVC